MRKLYWKGELPKPTLPTRFVALGDAAEESGWIEFGACLFYASIPSGAVTVRIDEETRRVTHKGDNNDTWKMLRGHVEWR